METYNGWVNRETWATALHIDNDPLLYEESRRIVDTHDSNHNAYALADVLSEWFTDFIYETRYYIEAGAPADKAQHQLDLMLDDIGSRWRINWVEIAENWLQENPGGWPRTPTEEQ